MLSDELRKAIKRRKSPSGVYFKNSFECNRKARKLLVEWLEGQKEEYDIGLLSNVEKTSEMLNAFADYLREIRPFRSEQNFRTAINSLCEFFSVPEHKVKNDGYLTVAPPQEDDAPIPLRPTVCNLCGGEVILMSNANIYGREYGSGKCYYCTRCHAFVGTHKPWPDIAVGLLADPSMRSGKKYCHALFDPLWNNKGKKKRQRRQALYKWLTIQMGLPENMGHFGYFDIHQLRQAYRILKTVKGKKPTFDKQCNNVIGFVD